MLKQESIKGIIFDYGGTLDTNCVHWSEVLWEKYQQEQIAVTKEQFRESYVYAERQMAQQPFVKPDHNFMDVLRIKTDLETQFLVNQGMWNVGELTRRASHEHVALRCYQHVRDVMITSRKVLNTLSACYPMVLVSNFYGNIRTVLHDFQLECFREVIESAVVGVRKPDPQIFMMGVEALGLKPEETVVIGDSYSKDIVPAHHIGCQTIWMKGKGWGNETVDESIPSLILGDLSELTKYMSKCPLSS